MLQTQENNPDDQRAVRKPKAVTSSCKFHYPFNSSSVEIMPLLCIGSIIFPHSLFWTSAYAVEDDLSKSRVNLIEFTQYLFVDANLEFSVSIYIILLL